MANPEHLTLLKKGVEAWNAWRVEDDDRTLPDLTGAQFSGANLEGIDLHWAKLDGANLFEARLCKADLKGTNFTGADLRGADLNFSELMGAVFVGADLRFAQLTFANLESANLTDANFFEGNPDHLAVFLESVEAWNAWRRNHSDLRPDLRGANVRRREFHGIDLSNADLRNVNLAQCWFFNANLSGADLTGARLTGSDLGCVNIQRATLKYAYASHASFHRADLAQANLEWATVREAGLNSTILVSANLANIDLTYSDLFEADLSNANLDHADLFQANLTGANLTGSNLSGARLDRTRVSEANLTDANLTGASLYMASMVKTVLKGASLTGCAVYGVSAWGLDLTEVKDQSNLLITPVDEPAVTVDNLEVAQFIYLMLRNAKIRDVIDTITGKGVLILGRFTDERKAVLDGLRDRLRSRNLVPMVFDWDKPTDRDLTETVQLLANMSRFVVADVTDARSIPQELLSIVPNLPSVPVRPIIVAGQREYAMFEHFEQYPWVLPVYEYADRSHLLENIEEAILTPIENWEAGAKKDADIQQALRVKDEEIERLRAALSAAQERR